jgi:hypothetical protein
MEGSMKDKGDIWETRAASDDYKAAEKYLTLLFSDQDAKHLVKLLRAASTAQYVAKDLLRASQTHLLGKNSPHVAEDLKKIKKGKKLSPVLLVRGNGKLGVTLIIADGYHRICASWHWDEKCPVACCLAQLESEPPLRASARNRQRR